VVVPEVKTVHVLQLFQCQIVKAYCVIILPVHVVERPSPRVLTQEIEYYDNDIPFPTNSYHDDSEVVYFFTIIYFFQCLHYVLWFNILKPII
jgi:hypothetical protein